VTIWAIVPVKPFNRSKSRLSSVLESKERENFSRHLLDQTLKTLSQVAEIGGILVVSRDAGALALARHHKAQTVQESGNPELNDALTRATQVVIATWNARTVLIAASDIPLMQTSDIQGMLALANTPASIVIATDRKAEGTNALLIRPPGIIPYCFGESSNEKHQAMAREAGIEPKVYVSPTMALDVDVPEDLLLYRQMAEENRRNNPIGSALGDAPVRSNLNA
jgi:2-phospho-L-lactate guanylyltransferase